MALNMVPGFVNRMGDMDCDVAIVDIECWLGEVVGPILRLQ